jgi:hypothetical protein
VALDGVEIGAAVPVEPATVITRGVSAVIVIPVNVALGVRLGSVENDQNSESEGTKHLEPPMLQSSDKKNPTQVFLFCRLRREKYSARRNTTPSAKPKIHLYPLIRDQLNNTYSAFYLYELRQ